MNHYFLFKFGIARKRLRTSQMSHLSGFFEAGTVPENKPVWASCLGIFLSRVKIFFFFFEERRILQTYLELARSSGLFFRCFLTMSGFD